jgi:hypothetical protein
MNFIEKVCEGDRALRDQVFHSGAGLGLPTFIGDWDSKIFSPTFGTETGSFYNLVPSLGVM